MKIIIEKYVCDICGKEVNATDRRYMITLGNSENWTDEAKISEDTIQKDLCHECYKTIAQLIGVMLIRGVVDEDSRLTRKLSRNCGLEVLLMYRLQQDCALRYIRLATSLVV